VKNRSRLPQAALLTLAVAAGCGRERGDCPTCDTVAIAAISEPATILPPLVDESVGRDIGDQIFERLAVLAPGGAPIDTSAYRPALAARWERRDSLSWRFRLRPGARWHDGRPVTSEDVQFSFEAFSDSAIGSVSQPYLAGRVEVVPEDSGTFLVRFAETSPEQLYDATYHVRIIPKHVWGNVPRASWAADTSTARLIGSGPFRLERWERGQFLILSADSAGRRASGVRRAIWRFTNDPDAALNLVLSHEADLLEAALGP
jgi:peptide/nickel transport system substrate-binding protein